MPALPDLALLLRKRDLIAKPLALAGHCVPGTDLIIMTIVSFLATLKTQSDRQKLNFF